MIVKNINGGLMIRDYEIKYFNNQEILFVYIDFNSEFAKINKKGHKKKLKKYLVDFIKRNNINFKGTTVAIMVSGMMVGTIILNKPISNKYENNINNNYIVSLVNNEEYINDDIFVETKNEVEEKQQIEDNIVEYKVSENKIIEYSKENESIKNNINDINSTNNNKVNNNVKEEVSNNNIITEEVNVLKTYVAVYRRNGEILNIELEEYLIGVVGAEMPASFNIEALKAQSVVARTYTLKALKNEKILTDDSSTQNYKSNNELQYMWGNNYNTYYNKVKSAVNSTKGMYLSYNGDYIDAVYHSTSNGKTENSKYVWGNNFSYLVSVDSPYDSINKNYLSTSYYSNETLSNKLGQLITTETTYNIISRNESGRVVSIDIDNIIYTGVEFRTKLGLRSTDFDIEKRDNGINITTRGYGHGVGMSQYGANGMANNGFDFKSILLHYYTGVSINYK